MLQDNFNNREFTNLLWSYSPNITGSISEEEFLKRYPGNDRVSLIGLDAYQWGTEEDFVKQLSSDINAISSIAKKNNKLYALTECSLKLFFFWT